MSWTIVRCWTLICDRCGDGWQDDAGQPHFDSEDAGLRYARDAGWTLTATGALCRQCTLCGVCSLTGHSGWRGSRRAPIRAPADVRGRVAFDTAQPVARPTGSLLSVPA